MLTPQNLSMFTGIIQGIGTVADLNRLEGRTQLVISLPPHCTDIQIGASISIAGICMTVIAVSTNEITIDAMAETRTKTTLDTWDIGTPLNIERSARMGDEIGGHILSGHITTRATISAVHQPVNNHILQCTLPDRYIKYVVPKGYIALDGASLTIVDVDYGTHSFSVHLIPHTLRATTFGTRVAGDLLNVEFDTITQTIVDTTERILEANNKHRAQDSTDPLYRS